MTYNFTEIEKKWRNIWEYRPVQADSDGKTNFYCLDMFPYPSGSGLHVGHWRGYVLSDVLSRYKILQGYNVLHPMGWDAFGLPAENYAISAGVHPAVSTAQNVANAKRQLQEMSTVYDWGREINTTDPEYYKWTQWIFLRMWKHGLAYEKEMPLNWCEHCKCVLANEESTGGVCDRCGNPVSKKLLRQWMLKITEYADRLLEGLEKLDWPEKVKKMQSDWIGKSYGAEVDFKIEGSDKSIRVFTTRPDTLYGATFMVLAPEHELVGELTAAGRREEMERYVRNAGAKSSVDRMADREKTGMYTGTCAINPFNGSRIQIWVSDYVLADYGTGAIMCVPAHDERDFEFAKKFGLPIIQVIQKEGAPETELAEAYTGDGVMINSHIFNGMKASEAKERMAEHMEKLGVGKKTVRYKLRDWVFSRQRYWGEPIPLIHCEKCGVVPVPESELPVLLPEVESYQPTSTGESPLADINQWVNVTCPQCHGPAKRETNTMPQWAGSSWYFLRYADPHNKDELASREALKKWLPVDYYVGGIEHAVLHLLYSRFYTKFLYDIGAVDFDEPFTKLFNQGMVNRSGVKMSKSLGNVVSPDELVQKYGCDSLRMYELFIGPPEQDSEWDDRGIDGVYRYLNRTWKFVCEYKDKPLSADSADGVPSREFEKLRNKFIRDITARLNNLTLNTVVSGFMEYTAKISDDARKWGGIDKETLETLIILLAPFTPHIAEELWSLTGHGESVFKQSWPGYDEAKAKDDLVTVGLQINGKLRGQLQIPDSESEGAALAAARAALSKRLEGFRVLKEVYVPNKIINFVVKAAQEE
ncbi:MAG: leucine--tRNA ligase [Clostridiales bacterium]|jgi:leucyl-tRNA synthetase|nr:leucine--tRNA ligase [Clostridiales bacterium]